jgi:hypothetical protein
MIPKHPPGPPMTLGNMRKQGVQHLIGCCLNEAFQKLAAKMNGRRPCRVTESSYRAWVRVGDIQAGITAKCAPVGASSVSRLPDKRKGHDRASHASSCPDKAVPGGFLGNLAVVQRHASRRAAIYVCIVAGTTNHRSAFFRHGHQSRSLQGESKRVHHVGRARGGHL